MCPLRKVSVIGMLSFLFYIYIIVSWIERWSPHEIAVFEAAITLFGKNFFRIQKYVCPSLLRNGW